MKRKYSSIELIKSFHIKSVFFRYWIKITLLMLLPFVVVTGVISSSYYIFSYNEAIHKIEYSVTEAVNYANSTMLRLDEYVENISINDECQRFLSLKDITNLTLEEANTLDFLRRYLRVQQQSSSDTITKALIYSFNNQYIISNGNCDFLKNFENTQWHNYYTLTKRQKYVISSENNTLYVCALLGTPTAPNGLIVYEILPSKLLNPTGDPAIEQFEFTFLNSYEECIFSTTEDFLADNYNKLKTKKQDFKNSTLVTKRDKNNDIYIESDINASLLYIRVNADNFINKYSLITTIILLVLLLIILTPLVISLLISWYFYKEVFAIMQNLSPMENIYSVTKNANNEITFIINNIAKIQEDNVLLKETISAKIEELKQLQASVLQLQLNPHFLFNTLNSVNIVVMKIAGYKNLASTMIIQLSQLLRIALDTNNYIVSFENEINYSKKYIKIEEIKSGNRFDTYWDVDNNLMSCKTPKLILQPIIENAFTHGIKYLPEDVRGMLKISITQQAKNIVISITNNGPQIPGDELQKLNLSLKNGATPEFNRVGLNNVNRRIQLLFGKNYGCFIKSGKEETTVEITIPKVMDFTDENN